MGPTTSRRQFIGLLAGAGSLAILSTTTACSASGDASTTGDGAAGGTLTLLQGSSALSLDPAKANAGSATQYTDLAYSSLLHWTGDNTFEPALAESYEFVGEGNTQFQLKLRSGVKFSDGTALDSAAVKSHLEYFQNADGPFSGTAKALIASVDTPDATTVVVTFSTPNPDAPAAFSEGGGWGAIISPAVLTKDPSVLGASTAGAGPYMLDAATTVTGSTYTYVPNPNFYAPDQRKWDKVVIKVLANANSALQAVTTGQNSWMQGTWQQAETAKASNLQVKSSLANVYALFLIGRGGELTPALGDVRVRQALNYAVDREAIAKLLNGKPNQQIIAEGYTGYSQSAASTYSFDTAKAKDLLTEAGYGSGFEFTVIIGSFDPNVPLVAQALAAQFEAIGVKMDIATAAAFPDFARQQGSKQFSADIESWGSSTMYSVAQQLVLPTGVVNPWQNSDEQMVALYQQAASQPADQAVATWEQLSQRVTEQAWYVPVATSEVPFIATEGLDVLGDCLPYPNPNFI